MESRRLDQAETHSELALAMNPNDPRIVAQRGELLTWLSRPDEGVEWIEKAMRVDPFGAPGRAHLLGRAFYTARRYAEAIDAFKKIVSPSYMHLAEVAACHARIGDQVCANESAVAALRLNPDFSVDQYIADADLPEPGGRRTSRRWPAGGGAARVKPAQVEKAMPPGLLLGVSSAAVGRPSRSRPQLGVKRLNRPR